MVLLEADYPRDSSGHRAGLEPCLRTATNGRRGILRRGLRRQLEPLSASGKALQADSGVQCLIKDAPELASFPNPGGAWYERRKFASLGAYSQLRIGYLSPSAPRSLRPQIPGASCAEGSICMSVTTLGRLNQVGDGHRAGLKPDPTSEVVVPEPLPPIVVRRSHSRSWSGTGHRLCRCGRTELARSNPHGTRS